jgi:UrcA family protein
MVRLDRTTIWQPLINLYQPFQETTMNTMTPSLRLRGLIATAIVGALASSFTTVCAAADGTNPPSVIVEYGDLNLSNSQGAATLYGRIAAAANAVCRPFDIDSRDLAARAERTACVHKAITDAVTKVGQPELFAVYNAKNHQSLTITVAQTR